jgi:hypothetical protein
MTKSDWHLNRCGVVLLHIPSEAGSGIRFAGD